MRVAGSTYSYRNILSAFTTRRWNNLFSYELLKIAKQKHEQNRATTAMPVQIITTNRNKYINYKWFSNRAKLAYIQGLNKLEGQWRWIPRELQQCAYAGCQFLLKLTLEMTNYFANKKDHAMKEKQITFLHHHSLLTEDISWTDETSWKKYPQFIN